MTTRSPTPSAAMSSSMPRFTEGESLEWSIRCRQWLGLLDLERGAVHGERAGARLGAQQLEAELFVGVTLAQQRAVLGRRRRRVVGGLVGRHLRIAARDGDLGFGCAYDDDRR